jgi:hypothetical protein
MRKKEVMERKEDTTRIKIKSRGNKGKIKRKGMKNGKRIKTTMKIKEKGNKGRK